MLLWKVRLYKCGWGMRNLLAWEEDSDPIMLHVIVGGQPESHLVVLNEFNPQENENSQVVCNTKISVIADRLSLNVLDIYGSPIYLWATEWFVHRTPSVCITTLAMESAAYFKYYTSTTTIIR